MGKMFNSLQKNRGVLRYLIGTQKGGGMKRKNAPRIPTKRKRVNKLKGVSISQGSTMVEEKHQ